jgi:hypothetical protein
MSPYGPTAVELLDVWDAGHALPPVPRALALLTIARPDLSPESAAELPIGRRDAELLILREHLFGPRMVACARCAACAERFELSFMVSDIRVTPADEPTVLVQCGDYAVRVRAANSADLMAVAADGGPDVIERALVGRCTLDARRGVVAVPAHDLPDDVAVALADAMGLADPQADVQVMTVCPACGHQDEPQLDVAAFLWRELDAWAARTLDEVHALASAYGWSEREILSMSAARRRRYVAMIAPAS